MATINQKNLITVLRQKTKHGLTQKDSMTLVNIFSWTDYQNGCFARTDYIAKQLGTQSKIVQKSINTLLKKDLLVSFIKNSKTCYKVNPKLFI